MLFADLFKTASIGVTVNKPRSLLTMLGIIIGVCSVVLMTGIGKSMENVILSQISTLGSKNMVIFPGAVPQHHGGGTPSRTGYDSITFDDLEALRKLTTITSLAPNIFVTGDVTYGKEDSDAQVTGITPTYFINQDVNVAEGRLIDQRDIDGIKSVAVIGPDIVEDLFFNQNPIGKRIKIAGNSYTVVGTFSPIGSQFFQNFDDRIFIPFSKAKIVTGQRYINFITLQAVDNFDVAFADVRLLLRQRHQIDNPENDTDKDDFIVRSSEQAAQILGSVSLGLTVFITMIAGISLIVGGIGIMNIMLVVVSERTHEIGLRKAIGATKRNILFQFLIESILLTLIGGLIGIVLGIFLAYVIALIAHRFLSTYVFDLSIGAIVLAIGMAGLTGLIFGIYPAKKAADLSPMEALRYE